MMYYCPMLRIKLHNSQIKNLCVFLKKHNYDGTVISKFKKAHSGMMLNDPLTMSEAIRLYIFLKRKNYARNVLKILSMIIIDNIFLIKYGIKH